MLTGEQESSRYVFFARMGGGPRFLPEAQVYIPNPFLRLAYRCIFYKKIRQAEKDCRLVSRLTKMNLFDEKIILFLNQFAHKSRAIDNFINFIANQMFLKSGILVILLWWFWFQFKDEESNAVNREHILATITCCLMAICLGRILALSLPFRQRPMYNPALLFQLPYGSRRINLRGLEFFSK